MASIRSRSLPLPRGWPRRVRAAVVQAISLARASMALAHGWASESLNPALRRHADESRLHQEIQLLREEIRIKDAHMEQMEPHRRPHYPPTERLAALQLRAVRGWSLAQAARVFLVTPLTIASWTQRLDEGGPDSDSQYHAGERGSVGSVHQEKASLSETWEELESANIWPGGIRPWSLVPRTVTSANPSALEWLKRRRV